jgi:hypothetical protein
LLPLPVELFFGRSPVRVHCTFRPANLSRKRGADLAFPDTNNNKVVSVG